MSHHIIFLSSKSIKIRPNPLHGGTEGDQKFSILGLHNLWIDSAQLPPKPLVEVIALFLSVCVCMSALTEGSL